ncbi:uncharacterized protein LOC120560194 isoform X1 [Perca fluviatilis]|uniref:uncharacterized protein LOC120560194 isoform X1 n=1 Tax=Perca fluviatilis TaxID=8168 RepID=UPI0019649A29|nr:uncharacterized protein LOC120560194 isoform X1 [Perca fluviatilis]
MSSVECLREFVTERLTAAAEEIFRVVEKTIVEYEEEIARQRRLLDGVWRPEIRLHRIELPQQHVCKEEEVLSDQQLCIQERNSSLDREDPEPPQIKEEQEELCISQEGEQLVLKQETDTFMLTPTYEERDHSEGQTLNFNPDDDTLSAAEKESVANMPVITSVESEVNSDHQLLSHNSHEAESQDQKGGKHGDSGSTRNAEPEPKKRRRKSRSHRNSVDKTNVSEIHPKTQTELPQQHVCKEEEVLSDQQLCIQERNSSLDQEDPEPPPIKEDQEELCISQEGEQLVLKQETNTFMLTPTYEDRDHSEGQALIFNPDDDALIAAEKESVANMPVLTSVESEANSDHQLPSHNYHEAESQDQKGGKHGDSGPTRNAEPEPKKRQRKSRNLSNNVDNTNVSEIHPNTQTELPQQHVCKEEEVLSDQQLNMPVITSVVSEANSDHQLLAPNSHEAESQDQKGGKYGDSGPTRNAEPETKKRRRKSRSHSNNVDNTNVSEIHPNTQTELPQQHVCKEEEVLSDQQLNMPVLTSVVSEANSDHQLLSHNSLEAESQDQKGGKHGDSGSTRNAEPEPKKGRRKRRSHSNNVDNTNVSEIHPNTQTELPQQHVCKEEEVLSDQQLCIQERNSSLDQEDPESPQIKEDQEELCTSKEGEQLVLKQETDTFMLTPTYEERDHSEGQTLNFNPDDDTLSAAEKESVANMPVITSVESEANSDHQLLSPNSHETESQDQKGGKHGDSGSTRNAEPEPKKRRRKRRSHSNNVVNTNVSEIHPNTQTELPQQHVCKEEEVLSDQQLCIQERNSSLDQEDPEPPQIKEDQEELCISQEGEQLVLKQETDTFMLTPTYEERDHSEGQTLNLNPHDDTLSAAEKESVANMPVITSVVSEANSDHQLLSHNCHQAESQDQKGGKHGDSGSTRNAEPEPKKKRRKSRSHSNIVDNTNVSEIHPKTQTELPQQHVCKEEEVLSDQQLNMPVITSVVSEANSDHQLLSPNSHEAESQDQKGGKHGDSGSTRCSRNLLVHVRRIHTELPQQHGCKEEEVLSDQQLCIQERNSSLDQEDPEPPQIKEDQEELCTSQEGEQLVLKQETDTFMLTPTYEERDHSEGQTLNFNPDDDTLSAAEKESVANMPVLTSVESEVNSDHQLLSHNSHEAESQDQKGGKHGDSGSTRNAEPEPKKRRRKSRSHSNNVDKTNVSEIHPNTQTGKKSFICETCGKDFKYNSALQTHLRIHTGEKPYSCKSCGKDFRLKDVFNVHMRTHTGEKPYVCKTCGKRFCVTTTFKRHMRIHTGEKPYPCKTCGKEFRQNSYLLIHIRRAHTGEKPYVCKTCSKRFCDPSDLLRHMRIHTGEKPYSCKTCGKDFRFNGAFNVHMRTHTREKLYVCKTCGKRYRDDSALQRHMRIHTGEKPYSCKTCGKDFRRKDVLNIHLRIHTGEKPYSCKTCEKGFRRSSTLLVHMRRAHTGEMLYICKTCGKRFFDASGLMKHMRTHRG